MDITLDRWFELSTRGWHPGNTHIHYDEKETRPDERLQLGPRVEDLRMTAVSILQRWDLEYATNKYSPGVLTEFTSSHHYVECGEENRHNKGKGHDNSTLGYGHIMLLNIQNVVHPVSRGLLVDAFDPDYPPLSYAWMMLTDRGGLLSGVIMVRVWKLQLLRCLVKLMLLIFLIQDGWILNTTYTTKCLMLEFIFLHRQDLIGL
ncbi:MAG: hypothetical protein CM1200mP37_8640 [Chloroflexota bacterium]|nr:MAG: hypothetical protein CM1200mP37_8640 [Chloroflexota bacterium]